MINRILVLFSSRGENQFPFCRVKRVRFRRFCGCRPESIDPRHVYCTYDEVHFVLWSKGGMRNEKITIVLLRIDTVELVRDGSVGSSANNLISVFGICKENEKKILEQTGFFTRTN